MANHAHHKARAEQLLDAALDNEKPLVPEHRGRLIAAAHVHALLASHQTPPDPTWVVAHNAEQVDTR